MARRLILSLYFHKPAQCWPSSSPQLDWEKRGVVGASTRGRSVSVCVSPEGWTVCFNDVCSCNVERWIYLSSILPHLDCIRINCTTSKSHFTFIPFLLLLLLSVSGHSCFFFQCVFLGHVHNFFLLQPLCDPDVALKSRQWRFFIHYFFSISAQINC